MRHIVSTAVFLGATACASAADPQLLNLVMPEAKIVAGVNIAKAKTSPFGQFVLRQMPDNADFAQFVAASGFDPRRDLQEVVMATGAGQKTGLVVARGAFDAAKIAALAVADGKHQASTYNGAQLVTAIDPANLQAFAMFDNGFAAAGDLASVKSAIDRRKGSNPVNPLLASKIALYGAADAWTVSLVPLSDLSAPPQGAPPLPGPLQGVLQGDLLKKITESSGSITFDAPVHINGEFVTGTDQDASALGDVVKFLASMVQTNSGASAVTTLIQSLSVSTQGNVLKLGLAIPEAQLENLFTSSGKKTAVKGRIERL